MNLHILGTRGVPARHGGFETFAEQLALYMVSRGHDVTVYCQSAQHEDEFTDRWQGIRRISFAEADNPRGTVRFDLRSAYAASQSRDVTVLTLGYNTALFSILHRLRGVRHYMNMDGIEWKRQKWSPPQRLWLRLNEWLGAHLSTGLIADHPAIKEHLNQTVSAEKTTVIPYGADSILQGDVSVLDRFGVTPGNYLLVIARPEPENSILEIVQAFKRKPRSFPLVVLGRYKPGEVDYHARVLEAAAGANILFPGAIYEQAAVTSLRYFATAYVHGHQVGGTNPSLVEALAAGNAILAHDNRFNRWVAGPGARFFSTAEELSLHFDELESAPHLVDEMKVASRHRHALFFRRELILSAYEEFLSGTPITDTIWSVETNELANESVSLSSA